MARSPRPPRWPVGLVALMACAGAAPPRPPAPIQNTAVEGDADPACADPISGVWTARVWRDRQQKWDMVVLTIRRTDQAALEGTIEVFTWDGDADQRRPRRCSDGSPAMSHVIQSATGALAGDRFDLQGAEPRWLRAICAPTSSVGYQPDHFSGVLQPTASRLDTVNDDGNTDQGRPHVFSRTTCVAPVPPAAGS